MRSHHALARASLSNADACCLSGLSLGRHVCQDALLCSLVAGMDLWVLSVLPFLSPAGSPHRDVPSSGYADLLRPFWRGDRGLVFCIRENGGTRSPAKSLDT